MGTFSWAYKKACDESEQALFAAAVFTSFVVLAVWLVTDALRA